LDGVPRRGYTEHLEPSSEFHSAMALRGAAFRVERSKQGSVSDGVACA